MKGINYFKAFVWLLACAVGVSLGGDVGKGGWGTRVSQAKGPKFQIHIPNALKKKPVAIELWVRGAGSYTAAKTPAKLHLRAYEVERLPLKKLALYDYQYGKKLRYKGFYVGQLIRRYRAPNTADLALLHFANRMIVPYPLRVAKDAKKLKVFVAVAWQHRGKWTHEFPDIQKKDPLYKDLRPLRFEGNKVVVTGGWHPTVAPSIAKALDLWHHVDALRGVEFVDAKAYYKQFDISKRPEHKAGLKVFRGMCQFCHGTRRVGAGFGVDLISPAPVHLYKTSPEHLRFHIRNRELDATRQGLLMPALNTISKADAKAIWLWLKGLWDGKKLNAYQPPK